MLPWKIKIGDVLMIEQVGADEWSIHTTARGSREVKENMEKYFNTKSQHFCVQNVLVYQEIIQYSEYLN